MRTWGGGALVGVPRSPTSMLLNVVIVSGVYKEREGRPQGSPPHVRILPRPYSRARSGPLCATNLFRILDLLPIVVGVSIRGRRHPFPDVIVKNRQAGCELQIGKVDYRV